MDIQPRVIRLKDASSYLGMDKNRFNDEVRPYLTEIPIGNQGIGFDRLDLDEWFEEYKNVKGRPGKQKGGEGPWRKERAFQVSSSRGKSGTLIKQSEEEEFANLVRLRTSKKQKSV